MEKYSEEFKIKLVNEYLYGNLGYKSLARKYNMGSETSIVEWVKVYKSQGMDGLKRRQTRDMYPVQFKLDTIQFMLKTGASFLETAVQFNLNNPSLIRRWMKEFKEQGLGGLKPKGRPSMSRNPTNQRIKKRQN